LLALQELASYHRSQLGIPVLAITGSNGKTTTKELICKVLSQKYRVIATEGNFNNHIGVPLSLLRITKHTEVAIIEMGANHTGEIKFLCSLAQPTHGMITNIGKAHLEGFGSIDGVKKAKSELYDNLNASEGLAFVNLSELYLEDLSSNVPKRIEFSIGRDTFPQQGDYRFLHGSMHEGTDTAPGSVENGVAVSLQNAEGEKHEFKSALYGEFNVPNVASAIVVGLYFKVGLEAISTAIRAYKPENNRSQIVIRGKKTILLDAYNANPVSMELAIRDLDQKNGAKSLILGGMNELGDYSFDEHLKLLELIDQSDWEQVILIGEHFKVVSQQFDFQWFVNVDDCKLYLQDHMLIDGYILLKGSRSLKLESLLEHIK
jgi:UDP-N-acetylmuramoyl-tripeptide--D-alanyl-D-alanine ligase